MSKWSASITVAGLALGSLLLAGSPAGAQTVYAPYMDQRGGYQQQPAAGWGGNNYNGWSGHTNSAWGGNTNDPRFDRRDAYQQQRIQQGIESGSLTPGEARYLEREQGRIDRAADRMQADGNLSPREQQRLNQMQNQASRDIYRMENNNRTAGYDGNQAGWQGRDRDRDRRDGWQDRDRGWDRRDYGQHDQNRGWDNRGGDGRNYGWHGNNPVGAGNGYNHGWQTNGNSGWHGNNPAGGGTTTNGTTTAGYTQGQTKGNTGWRGNSSGGSGYTTGGTATSGTTSASNTQGWQGNSARNGQPGAYQQPGSQAGARPSQPAAWQGQQQYQRPSFQGAQPQMRPSQPAPWQGQQYQQARMQAPQPNFNMTPRQPSMYGGMVNRANFSFGGARRR